MINYLGLQECHLAPLLLNYNEDCNLFLIVGNVVDDLRTTKESDCAEVFIQQFDEEPAFRTVVCGPGTMEIFGISIKQSEDHTIKKMLKTTSVDLLNIHLHMCDESSPTRT